MGCVIVVVDVEIHRNVGQHVQSVEREPDQRQISERGPPTLVPPDIPPDVRPLAQPGHLHPGEHLPHHEGQEAPRVQQVGVAAPVAAAVAEAVAPHPRGDFRRAVPVIARRALSFREGTGLIGGNGHGHRLRRRGERHYEPLALHHSPLRHDHAECDAVVHGVEGVPRVEGGGRDHLHVWDGASRDGGGGGAVAAPSVFSRCHDVGRRIY
mmetsp:Transcript_2165/g.4727  ORF Transcript_2165/g.4727 Transcript_2165/m.4727 type:complete len:210 (-) Transcript_2165:145-774(-)